MSWLTCKLDSWHKGWCRLLRRRLTPLQDASRSVILQTVVALKSASQQSLNACLDSAKESILLHINRLLGLPAPECPELMYISVNLATSPEEASLFLLGPA